MDNVNGAIPNAGREMTTMVGLNEVTSSPVTTCRQDPLNPLWLEGSSTTVAPASSNGLLTVETDQGPSAEEIEDADDDRYLVDGDDVYVLEDAFYAPPRPQKKLFSKVVEFETALLPKRKPQAFDHDDEEETDDCFLEDGDEIYALGDTVYAPPLPENVIFSQMIEFETASLPMPMPRILDHDHFWDAN